jgi:hypothetical protein
MKMCHLTIMLVTAGVMWPCALTTAQQRNVSLAIDRPQGVLIQPGQKLALLGVTDDEYAIYQDGTNLYATALVAGAHRSFVAEIGDRLPFVQIAGKVAFIWTDRPRNQLAGVSPLIVWTADAGPKSASARSMIATWGSAASRDGRQIMFITNVDANGAIGDLVSATPDLRQLRSLVTNIAVDYSGGTCVPFVGFAGHGPHSFPVADYCRAGAATATLTAFIPGATMSIDNVLPSSRWQADPAGKLFITSLADSRSVASVTARGNVSVLDPTPNFGAFLNRDGAVIEVAAQDASQVGELRRIELGPPPSIATLSSVGGAYYTSLTNGSGYYTDSPTSQNGKQLLYYDNVDPKTGLTDLKMIDVSRTPTQPVELVHDLTATTFGELFTEDSSHALYYVADPSGNLALYAASSAVDNRQISDGFSAWNNFAATGSRISYLDHAVIDPNDTSPNAFPSLGTVTADLHIIDVAAPRCEPWLLAKQAYAGYFPTQQRKSVVYSWDRVLELSGLYVAWAAQVP